MTLSTRQQARRETVALTRQQVEDILYSEFCMNRDDAEKFWRLAEELQPAGAK